MTARALAGVLRARMHAQRRIILCACAAAFVVGFIQPRGAAGPVFFGSLLGIALALSQGPGRYPHLDRCEQSAPLFGRELARAKALIPCIAAGVAVLVYACAQLLRASPDVSTTLPIALGAVVASTLTAMSATVREGVPRALYVLLAAATSFAAYALAVWGHSVPGALAFCAIVSFLALRQYGEALARYDPIYSIELPALSRSAFEPGPR
jgi:hypothetical protein